MSVVNVEQGGSGCPVFTPWDNKLSALSHRPGRILPVKSCPFYELNKFNYVSTTTFDTATIPLGEM